MTHAKTPSRCHKCIRKAKHKLVDKWYCDRCFTKLVEQNVRRHLRVYGLKRDSKLSVNDKGCEYLLNRVVNIPIKIVHGRSKADFLVMPWTLDDENEEFLKWIIENRKMGISPRNASSPSMNGEFDNSSTSQLWASFCIQVPTDETQAPHQIRRKSLYSTSALNVRFSK